MEPGSPWSLRPMLLLLWLGCGVRKRCRGPASYPQPQATSPAATQHTLLIMLPEGHADPRHLSTLALLPQFILPGLSHEEFP